MGARVPTEEDILGGKAEHDEFGGHFLEWGSVGWEGDASDGDVLELGDGTNGPLGRPLLRVTLHVGRDITKRPVPGVAQGRQVRCQLGWPMFVPYPLGMQVLCAFAGGDIVTSGNGAVLQGAAPAPVATGGALSSSRIVLDGGPTKTVAMKGLNVSLLDHTGDADGSYSAWLTVGKPPGQDTPGVYASDGNGGGITIGGNGAALYVGDGAGGVGAIVQVGGPSSGEPGIGLLYNGASPTFFSVDALGNWTMLGLSCALTTSSGSLGAGATPATPILWGPVGMAGVGSATWFVSL
jgi:hypothetical protein